MAGYYSLITEESFTNSDSVEVVHNADSRYVTIRLIVNGESRDDLISEVVPVPLNENNAITVKLTGTYSGRVQILNYDISTIAPDLISREQIQARAWDRLIDRWGIPAADVVAGWMGVFSTKTDLLNETPTVNPSYAASRDSGYNTGAAEQSFRMHSWNGSEWLTGDYLDPKPSQPVPGGGVWLIDISEPHATGDSGWGYWMGTLIRAKASAVGKELKAIAVQRGSSGGGTINYQILRSTAVSASRPSNSSFSIVEENGNIQSLPSDWATQALTSNIEVTTENSWYIVWAYVGVGGTNLSISSARGNGWLIEDDFDIVNGVYKSTGSGHPSSASGAYFSSILYGISSVGAGDP